MSDPSLRALVGDPVYRPLFEYIARETGVTERHNPLDREARIDPLELAGQKALRDFGLKFFEDCGWALTLAPPHTEARPRQREALSE